ncbi:MAG: hypothetical protein K8R88_01680 [Armatimonadetes bacterium]|nr:hypothetical protein [Armatimonadota bacterium]
MSANSYSPVEATAWERAFLKHGSVQDDSDWAEVYQSVAEFLGTSADDWDVDNLLNEVLQAHEICSVGIEFPDSMHGDGISVQISRFPGGTVVGLTWSTCDELPARFVLANPTLDDVIDASHEAIYSCQDGADWGIYDEGDEKPEDGIPACWVGFDELKAAFANLPDISS